MPPLSPLSADELLPGGPRGRFVAVGRVVHVGKVVDLELPVAAIQVAVDPAPDLDLAVRRAVREVFQADRVGAEPVAQTRSFLRKVGEHEAAQIVDPGDPSHAVAHLVGLAPFRVALRLGDEVEIAVRVVCPAVIHAHEAPGVALFLRDHLDAPDGRSGCRGREPCRRCDGS